VIEQRKTVTVVFADLVESTSTSERLDPEVWSGVLRRYFEALRAAIEKHGGSVEKFIGDAIVGVFGVPTLHEDDALRAVRAALDIHDAVRPLSLQVRVGVNTGEVVVSGDNALGHAISMAARLEQNADAGEVLIGKRTFALVADSFDTAKVEALTVKGSADAVDAWRVIAPRQVTPRGSRAGAAYVGRERELARIRAAYDTSVNERTCVTLTIVAPPGMGKSRLMSQAVSTLPDAARVLVGRCLPYGEAITYLPLIEAVRQLEIAEGAAVLERALDGQADAEQVLGRVCATIDGAANGSPDETSWAFRRLLEALAAQQPVVLIIDDIHWADPLLLDLIEYVGTFSAGEPVLLLCATRPDLLESRPGWFAPRDNALQLRVAPLSDAETDGLLATLDVGAMDEATRKRIVATSAGVPLFAEQLAAFDAEGGAQETVPPTIRALLAARVDRLAPDERLVLQHAAIQGPTFHMDTLSELVPEDARAALGGRLMALVRREFVRPENAPGAHDTFAFNHALIRDAVYDQMPRRARADLHERFSAIAERRGASSAVIAHHLDEAYRERAALGEPSDTLEELALRAGAVLAVAGREATARKETTNAVELLRRAADLLSNAPAQRLAVLAQLIDALVAVPDIDGARAVRDEAASLATALGDETSALRAELAWTIVEQRVDMPGWQDRTMSIVDRAIDRFTAARDEGAIAQALVLKALAIAQDDQPGAIATLKSAHEHALRSGDERIQVEAWDELGGAMIFGPTPFAEVLEFVRGEVAWAREHGVAFTVADGRLGEAYATAALGRFDEAVAILHELIEFFAGLPGKVSQHGECYTLAGRIERDRNDSKAALANYQQAMEIFEGSGHRRWWRNAAPGAAHALLDLGRDDEARAILDAMPERDGSTDIRPGAFQLEAEARYAARTGDARRGLEFADRAVGAVADTGALFYEGRARETRAELLTAAGDIDAARSEYARARDAYERKGYLPGVARIDRLSAA
jgi:class 3 adenylate cyclase/tetratricopeptide (TPR) repeat protein